MIWLNGRLVARGQAHIDPADRGFLLADGLFETLLARRGHVAMLGEHLQRLAEGAAELGIPLPLDPPGIAEAVRETLHANHLLAEEAALRITLTRGPGQRGLLPPDDPRPSLLISAAAYHPPAVEGFAAITATRTRRNEKSLTARLKTLGYLDNVIAQTEAAAAGADEAIMLNGAGQVACGARSNLFAVIDGILMTPPIGEGALPGITRRAVLELCKAQQVHVAERAIAPASLRAASEMFITNSLLGLMPVRRLDGADLAAGSVARRLAQAYCANLPC
jgi:branched-chain amino acid aminotransferase